MQITEEYLRSLNPTCCSEPTDFGNYYDKIANIEKLVNDLKSVDSKARIDRGIQDANHYVEILTSFGALRFSKFDDLVAITSEENFPPETLKGIIEKVQEHGYNYVPWHFFGEPFKTRDRINGDLFNQLFDFQ